MIDLRLILESWRNKLAEAERDPENFTFASPPEFAALHPAHVQENHGLAAAQSEALAMADLALIKGHPDRLPLHVLGSLSYLVLAGHRYRLAGAAVNPDTLAVPD